MMIGKSTKDRISEFLRNKLLQLDNDEVVALRLLYVIIRRYRFLLVGMLSSNIFSAFFAGSTVGIIIFAINFFISEEPVELFNQLGVGQGYLSEWVQNTSRNLVFLTLVVFAVIAELCRCVFQYLGVAVTLRLNRKVSQDYQAEVTNKIMSLDYSEASRYSTGVLYSLVQSSDVITRVLLPKCVNDLILAGLMLCIYLTLLTMISVPLTLSAVVVFGVFSLFMTKVVKKLTTIGRRITSGFIYSGKLSIEYLNAPRLLRLFNGTGFAAREINKARFRVLSSTEKSGLLGAAIDPAIQMLSMIGIAMFIVVGFLVLGGTEQGFVAQFMAALIILQRLTQPVKSINGSRTAFGGQREAILRVGMLMNTETSKLQRVGGLPFSGLRTEIRLSGVNFKYASQAEYALKDIELSIKKGTMLAVVGKSGAGKSTLVDLLLGLYVPTGGSITIDGLDLNHLDSQDWLRHVGVVDQEVFLLNTSISQNISFGREGATQDDIVNAARMAYAEEFILGLDDGYETIIGDRGHRLSGGQQQRIALARALLQNPGILIFDEATSALDSESEQKIQKTLESLNRTHTVVVIAHRLSTIRRANDVVVLDKGRIVEQGNVQSLLALGGMFSRIWKLQNDQGKVNS